MKQLSIALTALIVLCSAPATAQHASQYAGQQNREIKALSAEDVKELLRGGGWGLAKPAELNGMPGPAHILELKDKIALTSDQEARIQSLFASMQAEAKSLGEELVEKERDLDTRFKSRDITEARLEALLSDIAAIRSKLRFAHLSAHLKTPEILSGEQVAKYNELRGYAKNDPCANLPEGHDVERWRKHNNCE